MDEATVRDRATAMCEALVAGDVGLATADFSEELHRNLGEVVALFPLPSTEATIESVEHTGAGYTVVLRLVGETEEVMVQTRWKDRDGEPRIVEVSHRSQVAVEAATAGSESEESVDAETGGATPA